MATMLAKITNWLILFFIFLLPWQTRWIYSAAMLNNQPWEYGTLSFYATEILLWLIVVLTGLRFFANKYFWKEAGSRSHFLRRWPALIFGMAIAFFVAYFYAVSPVKEISVQFMSRLIGSICIMACLMLSGISLKEMGMALWGGGVAQGCLAIGQFFVQQIYANKWLGVAAHKASDIGAAVVQSDSERWLRSYGSFGWPNSLGVFLAVSLIIGLLLYNHVGRKWQPLFLGGQMIILAGLLFSFSRGAWVAALAGATSYLIIALLKKARIEISSSLKQIVFGALISVIIVAIYFPLFNARANAVGYLENLSIRERADQYKVGEAVIADNLFFGVGPGLYTYYLADKFSPPSYGMVQPVHNIYILSFAELGILMYLCLNVLVVWLIHLIWKKNPLYLSVVTVLLTARFFDHYLWSLYAGQALFWVVFGLGLAKNNDVGGDLAGRLDNFEKNAKM